jgi:hypothetical protein
MLKALPTDLNAAIKQARQFEKIILKQENTSASVSAIQLESAGGQDDVDSEIAALSAQFQALLKKRNGSNGQGGRGATNGNSGGRGGRGRGAPRGGANNNGANSYNVCQYCKKPGHLQKVCNSRIKAGAPQVDANCKPYTYSRDGGRHGRSRSRSRRGRQQPMGTAKLRLGIHAGSGFLLTGGTAPRCDRCAGNIVFVEELQVNKNLPTISINVMGNSKAEY